MIRPEYMRDGSLRLSSAECSFVFTRLRPGAILLSIFGKDAGQFEALPFAELEAETGRFGLPLELFVDTRSAHGVPPRVTEAWTSWFVAHQAALKRVSILVGSRPVRLAVSMVQHFSRTGGLMAIYSDTAEFELAIARTARGFVKLPPPGIATEPAGELHEAGQPGGALRLWNAGCSFEYRRPAPETLLLVIAGRDTGELGALPLDRLDAELRQCRLPARLFIDTSAVTGTTERVMEEWTAWLFGHQKRLQQVYLLASSQAMHLQMTIASYLMRTSGLITVESDPALFFAALERSAPGFRPLCTGADPPTCSRSRTSGSETKAGLAARCQT